MKWIPSSPRTAFTKLDLLMLIAVVALLAGVIIPALLRARSKARSICCNCNLKQVGLAFRIWSGDKGDAYPMSVSTNQGGTQEFLATGETFRHFQVLSNELSTPTILVCPSDRSRQVATDFNPHFGNTNLSYFVGVDASVGKPSMWLSGDRNLSGGARLANGFLLLPTNAPVRWSAEIHQSWGNIGMADGSVQQIGSARLREYLVGTGVATNRLAMP